MDAPAPNRMPAPFQRVQPGDRAVEQPVEPTAIASGRSSAIFSLGDVIKRLVDHSLAFHSENDKLAAFNVVDGYVNAHVADREMVALLTGIERAPVEDVSQRVPPTVGGPVMTGGPGLDYTKLAQAILREQQRLAARPAVESPSQQENTEQ